MSTPERKPPAPARHDEAAPAAATYESDALFGSRQEIVIRHNGREYRLRRTRLGKLILTA